MTYACVHMYNANHQCSTTETHIKMHNQTSGDQAIAEGEGRRVGGSEAKKTVCVSKTASNSGPFDKFHFAGGKFV